MHTFFTRFLLVAFAFVAVGADSALAGQIPPYEPPIEAHITVKWGNVSGTPQAINRVSFDGSMDMSDGDITLTEVLKFENHDDEKDRITNKQNPISWTSWIFNHWDGVRAEIVADPRADLIIETDAGSLTVPYATLLTAPRNTKLSFGDGREIVIKVNRIVTEPFYLYTIWGGPIPATADVEEERAFVEDFSAELRAATDSEAAFSDAFITRPDILLPSADFSGALKIGNGARGKLVETILFEPWHGDKITGRGENYVEWDSFIFGHYDGLFLKMQLDQQFPVDDVLDIKFDEIGFSTEVSLVGLYVYGTHVERVIVDGLTYLVGFVAVDAPFCDLNLHPENSAVCDRDPDPVPFPLPVPVPQPTPQPVSQPMIEPVIIEDFVLKPPIADALRR